MPEHMKRREAIYYFRRVLPLDLQASLGRREICRSLKTSDFAEAKERLHRENVRFDQWVRAERERLAMVPANENARPSATAEAMQEYSGEADAFFAKLHFDSDELPYAEWLPQREKLDREADRAHLEEEQRNASLSLLDLFEQYARQPNSRPDTVKQFRAVITHFIAFLGYDNALRVGRPQVVKWRDHLREEPGPRGKPRSAKTINDTYLSALSAVYTYGMDRLLVTANPTSDVKRLPPDANAQLRERDFTRAEQRLILGATLKAPAQGMAAHNAAARRWVPWLCAYTGARVNEITQLRAMDVKQVEGVWTIHITPEAGSTKTNKARTVPIHEDLIDQGFLGFVEGKQGPLFYDPLGRRKEGGRPQYKKAGMKLAEWVRSLGIEPGVAPNHGWRHTFKTIAREVGIPEAAADYIQGHATKSQGRAYGTHNLATVQAELRKVPRFEV
jgi:integrase